MRMWHLLRTSCPVCIHMRSLKAVCASFPKLAKGVWVGVVSLQTYRRDHGGGDSTYQSRDSTSAGVSTCQEGHAAGVAQTSA